MNRRRTMLALAMEMLIWLLSPCLSGDYGSMCAQRMADESINYAPYECEDDMGKYPSSFPCENTLCVAKCQKCHIQLDCEEMKVHHCGDEVECPSCHQMFSPADWAAHDPTTCVSNNPDGGGNGGNGGSGGGGSGMGGSSSGGGGGSIGGGIGGSLGGGSSMSVSSGSNGALFSMTLAERKERALQLLDNFMKSQSAGVFPNFSAADVYGRLRDLLGNTALIRQGNNGTCGAAALCKYLLDNFPDKFVEMATSLYMYGTYEGLNLSVTEAMKQGTAQQLVPRDLSFVDALVQGSIINDNNGSMDYNPFEDRQYRGTMSMITIDYLLEMKMKGEDVKNAIEEFRDGTSSFMWPGYITNFFKTRMGMNVQEIYLPAYSDLKKIDYRNDFVFALVCCDFKTRNFTEWYPDHYVQITGANEKSHIINYWSWGDDKNKSYNERGTGIVKIYIVKQYEQNGKVGN